MDLNSAIIHANKLLDWSKSISNSDSKMYDKTKQRYKNIAEICNQIAGIISDKLQTEVMQPKSNESESTSSSDLQMQINFLNEKLDAMSALIVQGDISNHPKVSESVIVKSDKKINSAERKFIVKKYGETLQEVAKTDCGVSAANQCANIIWKWFDARIFTKYPNAPIFNYGIYRIKDIIYAIIITFGYHTEQGTQEKFLQNFDKWIETLSTYPNSNKWIAPYEVYKVERQMDKKYANLTAVVIFDILWDNGFATLCDVGEQHNANLNENKLYDKMSETNAVVLDKYDYYLHNESILELLNLI